VGGAGGWEFTQGLDNHEPIGNLSEWMCANTHQVFICELDQRELEPKADD
jgi:hypothetical protein